MPLEIRVERTNQTWRLSNPLPFPADSSSIESLLAALAALSPATSISPAEMRSRPKADEEYGFADPRASLFILQGDVNTHILVGARTVPGDQVFLQIVGSEGAYVVDAEWLKLIPRSDKDWRDLTVVNLEGLAFDRLAITNNAKWFVVQRDGANRPWRMVAPMSARADNARIEAALQALQDLRIARFISDGLRTDLDSLGLAPAELELAFWQGTNTLALLQFGKSPTNDATQVYAHRAGQNSIFTVSAEPLSAWRLSKDEFRDPHLLTVAGPIDALVVKGEDAFSLRRETNDTWRVQPQNQPQNQPADAVLVGEMLSTLTNMSIQLVKDAVTPPDLPQFGLASPSLQYVVRTTPANAPAGVTNIELRFGISTNQPDKVFALRTDESSVYAIGTNDFARLPTASWQLRERLVWHFSENDVTNVVIHQGGKERQIIHKAPGVWALAPGSQGLIIPLAVEATVSGLAKMSAYVWSARGEENRARYGCKDGGHQVSLQLKRGDKVSVEFGDEAPSGNQYGAVSLDGQLWIFECPVLLYRDVRRYLSVP
jgi:hypothetical protein